MILNQSNFELYTVTRMNPLLDSLNSVDAPVTTAATHKFLMANVNNLFSGSRHNSVYLTTLDAPDTIVNNAEGLTLETDKTEESPSSISGLTDCDQGKSI